MAWRCPVCTFENDDSKTQCDMCMAARPGGGGDGGGPPTPPRRAASASQLSIESKESAYSDGGASGAGAEAKTNDGAEKKMEPMELEMVKAGSGSGSARLSRTFDDEEAAGGGGGGGGGSAARAQLLLHNLRELFE